MSLGLFMLFVIQEVQISQYILPPSLQLLPLQHSISHSNKVQGRRCLRDPAIAAQAAFLSAKIDPKINKQIHDKNKPNK